MNGNLIAKGFLTYGVTGLRGKVAGLFLFLATPLMAEPVTVLALGDSLTQGYGLAQADGFVPQLERWLRAQGLEVDVINGGVSGDTSAGGAARVGWSLTPEVDAMIVTLGGNDFLRGIEPAVTRANIATILSEAGDVAVLLVGMKAPGNFGPDYKTAFDTLYPELAEAYGVLYHDDFFSGLGAGDPGQLRHYFQADGLHPNAAGVAQIIEDIGPRVVELIAQVK